jgi:hypothetical protein
MLSFGNESLLTGFTYGNHTPVRARIRTVPMDGIIFYDFEMQNMGSWGSPFLDGPAALYILK